MLWFGGSKKDKAINSWVKHDLWSLSLRFCLLFVEGGDVDGIISKHLGNIPCHSRGKGRLSIEKKDVKIWNITVLKETPRFSEHPFIRVAYHIVWSSASLVLLQKGNDLRMCAFSWSFALVPDSVQLTFLDPTDLDSSSFSTGWVGVHLDSKRLLNGFFKAIGRASKSSRATVLNINFVWHN